MAELKSMYQEVILDHNRKPRNYGELAQASHKANGHNPLCGDHLSVTLNLEGELIAAIAFQGLRAVGVITNGTSRTDLSTFGPYEHSGTLIQ